MDFQEEFNKLDLRKSFLIGVGVLGLYWVLFYNSGARFEAQVVQAQQTITKSKAALDQVRKALEDKKKFDKEIKDIALNMKDFQKYFAPDMDLNKLLSKVTTFAEQNEVTVNSLKPIEKVSEFPKYIETAVEFKIEGPFHNVMEFVSSLTRMQKAIDFSKMEFKTTVKGDYPLVELKTILVVYSSNENLGGAEGG